MAEETLKSMHICMLWSHQNIEGGVWLACRCNSPPNGFLKAICVQGRCDKPAATPVKGVGITRGSKPG